MIQQDSGSLGSGLALEDRLSLRLAVPDPHPQSALRLQGENEDALRILLSLDSHHVETGEEGHELAHELERLETKINLILELVGQVLARQVGLPEALPVRLSAREIEWDARAPFPVAGQPVLIELFLSAQFPRALHLPATVRKVAGARVSAEFTDLGEVVQDLLEQFIFRRHRRLVAASRRSGHSS